MFAALSTLLLVAVSALAQDFVINTPVNVVQCIPTLLSWQGGSGPYYISLQDGANPTGAAILSFAVQPAGSTSLTWPTNVTAGSYSLLIVDQTGTRRQSGIFNVASGSNTCLLPSSGGGSSASGSSTGGSSAAPVPVSSSTPIVSSAPATSSSPALPPPVSSSTRASSSASSSSSSTVASASSTPSGAASALTANVGMAGVAVAALAMFL